MRCALRPPRAVGSPSPGARLDQGRQHRLGAWFLAGCEHSRHGHTGLREDVGTPALAAHPHQRRLWRFLLLEATEPVTAAVASDGYVVLVREASERFGLGQRP